MIGDAKQEIKLLVNYEFDQVKRGHTNKVDKTKSLQI